MKHFSVHTGIMPILVRIKSVFLTVGVFRAALSSGHPDSGSRTGLGVAVGILAFAVVAVLAAVLIVYRRKAHF